MPNARHSNAGRFVQQRLFAGLSAFVELERRIADVPDEKSRGDAFEVFTEAYLATQRKHDAETVWPLSSVPGEVLSSLQLATQDYGVDGVLKTRLGKFSAYQVKYRTGRPALTWRELSTFMGLADSPNIHSRILLTNCDELPSVLNDRQGFFCIRGSDLDRLEPDDFKAIEAWLADAAFVAPRKQPQPHQTEALGTLLPALETHDRVSAIMACGTGKTLIALWVAEHVARASSPASSGGVPAARILVLVPSLALLRQILHEWLRETILPNLAYLCICSDPTVKEGLDSIDTKQSDLDFQVSTNAASVREFLDAPFTGTKIVFSTYQSAQVIGAALKPGEAFDLAVFDEAHKTAGREGRNFAFALEDANLHIRKRLFLTATPRHYNPHDRDREGEAKLLFSMDNPEVYGPQAYRLTFAEAARRGIICGYKVIISVITSEMVTNELLTRGEVVVNGDAVRARQVANQIALRDVIEKYGASKVFTFHKTVESAASFVADGSEGVRTHLPEFGTFHVNGTMPTARREREMRDFRATTRAVMSNARCLTEGVDVPAVDMVAFLSPRRSRVDIVQATGRAMRRSPGKTRGYVLVPLYVELATGETVEAAVNRAEFDEVWDVLNSLQEQDDVLAELIRYVGEQKGRGKGFDDSRFTDRIDFGGPRLGLDALRSAVTTRCLDSLYSSWDTWLGKLKVFKERFGHCNVETGWEEDPALAGWVSAQRTRRNKGMLYAERIRLLDELGFIWDFQTQKGQATWMKWYRELVTYAKLHGNPHVPRTHTNSKLASWVWIQRSRRDKTYGNAPPLTPDQVALLDKLGFRWDAREELWVERFEQLRQFKEEHGHFEIERVEGDESDLSRWVASQRRRNSSGELQTERKAKLDSIGFIWTPEDRSEVKWQEMYEQLKSYHTEHGDADVPSRWRQNPKLANWVSAQRERQKAGAMPHDQWRLLDELVFSWKQRERGSWEDRLAEVAAFKAKHGHCEMPVDKTKLGRFVNAMRTKKARGELSQQRIQLLEQLGFKWGVRDARSEELWETRRKQLLDFKAKHGHCNVPSEWRENPTLGRWLGMQRWLRKTGRLDPDKLRWLDEAGVNWGERSERLDADPDKNWTARYEQVLKFKERFGHCNVPVKWVENPQLGGWVSRQRQFKKSGRLPPDREELLTEAGFSWQESERGDWEDRYQELLAFKNNHGHCDVPIDYPENTKLGWFTKRMRAQQKNGTLAADKIAKLEVIGFDWSAVRKLTTLPTTKTIQDPVPASWKEFFDELLAYKMAHGDCDVPVEWKDNPRLGDWVRRQRKLKKRGKLLKEREKLLNEVSFTWQVTENGSWHDHYQELATYKSAHGDCDVPVKWKENPQLGSWAAAQRALKKSGKLHSERERLLNEIGFDWRAAHTKEEWEARFEQLKLYKQRFGDCCVPTQWKENPQLSAWVANQRHKLKSGKLSGEKERLLTELGFASSQRPTTTRGVNRAWSERFDELVQYKAQHGDCNVPTRWPDNRGLGVWVSNQRQLKKQGKLDAERERELNGIGFNW